MQLMYKDETELKSMIARFIADFLRNGYSADGLSHLQTACMGNAERTMGGEIFSHLKNVLAPYGIIVREEVSSKETNENNRSFDIVFSIIGSNGTPKPILIGEYKSHGSPPVRNGNPSALLKGINEDYLKRRATRSISILQIGLYPMVEQPYDGFIHPSPKDGSYPFLTSYCSGKKKNTKDIFVPEVEKWASERQLTFMEISDPSTQKVSFKYESETSEIVTVIGKYNWFVVLRD